MKIIYRESCADCKYKHSCQKYDKSKPENYLCKDFHFYPYKLWREEQNDNEQIYGNNINLKEINCVNVENPY